MDKCPCPICYTPINIFNMNTSSHNKLYTCNNCGNYAIGNISLDDIDKSILSSFLFYNNRISLPIDDQRYFYYIGTYSEYENIKNGWEHSKLATIDEINAWYPKTFTEKIDAILLGLTKLSHYIGSEIELSKEHFLSIYFVQRVKTDGQGLPVHYTMQTNLFIEYLSRQNYIRVDKNNKHTILPDGWKRIDELQKNQSNNKQAFVAMAFSEETAKLREKLREGIEKAGFFSRFIDEKEHNDQIVPEILYEIRKSKFVIAEFSDNNNGAYYEAGYAAGLGKEVIHVCHVDKFNEKGHFDIKQKSSILYKSIDEIPDKIHRRIKSTIT